MATDDLRRQTNPVYQTAKDTCLFLVKSGDDDAKLLAKKLGFSESDLESGLSNTVMDCNAEFRFNGANGFIEESGKDVIIDLPCGYTPRPLKPQFHDKVYIGCDLPAVTDVMAPAVASILEEEGISASVTYRGVDATNFSLMRDALSDVNGEVCISTEGLLMYLSNTELDQVCKTIHRILEEVGGCWMTPDPEITTAIIGLLRTTSDMAALEAFSDRFRDKANVGSWRNAVTIRPVESYHKAVNFFESQGFRVQLEPYSKHLPHLKSLEGYSDDVVSAAREVIGNTHMWILTVPEGSKTHSMAFEGDDFTVKAIENGPKVTFELSGRFDSVSAPEFLGFFNQQTQKNTPQDVVIDFENVEFISSAGIHTLAIIVKRIGKSHVAIEHANESVQKVLDEMGVSDLFE